MSDPRSKSPAVRQPVFIDCHVPDRARLMAGLEADARAWQLDAERDALEQIVQQEPPDRPLKIAVLDSLPASGKVYGTRAGYTKALHDYLGLGRGTLLIVTRRGPAMATDALPADQVEDILKRNASAIEGALSLSMQWITFSQPSVSKAQSIAAIAPSCA